MKPTLPLLAVLFLLGAPARADEPSIEAIIQDMGLKEADVPVRSLPGWKKPKKVAIANLDGPERLAWLQHVAPGVTLVAASGAAVRPLLKEADALIGMCQPGLMAAAPKLRWWHVFNAGVEACVGDEAIQSGRVLLTNLQRVRAGSMAEHVIAMMLAMTRGLPAFVRAHDRQEFAQAQPAGMPMIEVSGRTMLVVGLGGIGTEVARRAHALGMTVIATRNSGTGGPDFVTYVGKSDELLTLTPRADVIVNALPLTAETRDMMNAAFFARMKKGSYFINVGRGETVVQDALIAALNEGRIAGAGLDVVTPEPLPKDHPLWKARNLLITPHVSALSNAVGERNWLVTREQLRRYVAGEKMLSVVDPKRGY